MRRGVWWVAVAMAAVWLSGCSRGPAARRGVADPEWKTAVRRSMERQAQAARNAGMISTGDLEGDALRRLVLARPDAKDARAKLAAHYEATGQPELAVEHYRLLLGRAPEELTARLELIRLLHGMKLPEEALAAAVEGLRLAPARTLHSWKGILLDELDRPGEGEAAHRQALALSSGVPVAVQAALYNNLGQNLLLQKRYGEAVAAFEKSLAWDRRLETARNNLGVALVWNGEPARAMAHWRSLGGPANAHSNLAAVYMEQEKYQEARRELNIALGYDPSNAVAMRNLAAVSERDGRPAVLEPERVRGRAGWARIAEAIRTVFVAQEEREKSDRAGQARR